MIDPDGFLWHNLVCSLKNKKALMETSSLGQPASDPGGLLDAAMVKAGAGPPAENPSGAAS